MVDMGKEIATRWSCMVVRAGLFSLVWWALSDGVVASWWIGAPAVLLALIGSVMLMPPTRFAWHEFARFVPVFLVRSLRGGMDVAWRAFHPHLPIYPELIEYPMRLPVGVPRVFMVNTVSLLPGTLSAELAGDRLAVHVLDSRHDFLSELQAVEQSAARIFGVSLNTSLG